ncbi:uncharacterized protein [Parasteatoda tepidariorum]|nr:uncharacterized protein LOC107456708 [Parasteatoda tepidariorum]XP_015930143.2 uncharacterized protein LOC107456708 [Parasteatoda tepidariorum]
MALIFFLVGYFTVSSAIFFQPFFKIPNQRQSLMNVCIYSVDPAQYQPKCFLCPTSTYGNVLRTCVSAASIPSNVTYTQARCIEQNCAINRGKRSISLDDGNNGNSIPIPQLNSSSPFVQLYELKNPSMNLTHNYEKYRKLGEKFDIAGEEETLAMDNIDWEVEVDEEFAD